MIINQKLSQVDTNIEDGEKLEVEMNSMMYSVLSDKMYTNPIQSIIREVLSNAIDANIAAGVKNPVQVHFASDIDPVFYIKDAGIGMTQDEVVQVFGTYGRSSKREDNTQIGGLGLGAKTPFAYKKNGGMFTVESSKNGVKSTTVFYKDSEDIPRKKLLGTEPCEESGTKVSFSVDAEDYSDFIRESVPVFMFAMQMPEILGAKEKWLQYSGFNSYEDVTACREYIKNTLDIEQLNRYAEEDQYKESGIPCCFIPFRRNVMDQFSNNIIIEMGGVPYDVDLMQVFPDDSRTRDFIRLSRYKILHFPIGSLDFQASREKLNYTERTKSLLQRELLNLAISTFKSSKEIA